MNSKEMAAIAASGELYSQLQEITPEKAQQILDLQPRNRKVMTHKVAQYSEAILRGEWRGGHPQGLIFNREGLLMDGQHRLLAVIRANTPVEFYCTFNVQEDLKILLDTATPRTVGQTGQILGLETTPRRIAVAKALHLRPGIERAPKLSTEVILRTFQDYQAGIKLACEQRGPSPVLTAVVRAAIARAYYNTVDTERLTRFLEILDSGFSEAPRDACAIALRNACIGLPARKAGIFKTRLSLHCKALNAIQAFLEGRAIRNLTEAKVQPFPIALDND